MNATGPVEAFLSHLAVERRTSAHTLDAYRRDLSSLNAWAKAQSRDVLALSGEELRQFVASEHRRGLSPKSLQRRLSACRSFYRWPAIKKSVRWCRWASKPMRGRPAGVG